MEINDILIKPLSTEKMTRQGEKLNKYGFIVHKKANKIQIKEAVEKLYNVKVTSVNTMLYRGKRVVRYTKRGWIEGKRDAFKKAIVTLADGYTIDFYSNI
ncbi:MAG: 50S ribosomal protein L23 [Bacteroidales bacterium]|nr:50S ribosomal protein L23 [Bacteroidales bacterium]